MRRNTYFNMIVESMTFMPLDKKDIMGASGWSMLIEHESHKFNSCYHCTLCFCRVHILKYVVAKKRKQETNYIYFLRNQNRQIIMLTK